AVILDPARPIAGLDDSKRLTARRRDILFNQIIERAAAFHVVMVSRAEIDRINILQATMQGMRRAVEGLAPAAEYALVDGNRLPTGLSCPARSVFLVDRLLPVIRAASILAQVPRDRYMVELDARHPGYGSASHKGYGVAAHLEALARLGPCPEHRRSFAPVRRYLEQGLE